MEISTLTSELERLFGLLGYPAIFLISFVEISPFGWLIPGGSYLLVAGFFAYDGPLSLDLVLLSGWAGSWVTLILSYLLGAKTGNWLVKLLKQEKNAERARKLFSQNGAVILTTAMMANLTRFWSAYVAGQEKFNFLKFLFYSGAASLAWTSLSVGFGYLISSRKSTLQSAITQLGFVGWLFLLISMTLIYFTHKKQSE